MNNSIWTDFDFDKIIEFYKEIFKSDAGQIVLSHLGDVVCWENDVLMTENALTNAFREGQRSVLLHIKAMLKEELKNPNSEKEE